jgi:hypothetical protein
MLPVVTIPRQRATSELDPSGPYGDSEEASTMERVAESGVGGEAVPGGER